MAGNLTYEEISDRLTDVFFVEVERGDLAYNMKDGSWYEEYAHPSSKLRPYVLNGFMYSLIELHKAYKLKGDERLKVLFDRGIKALKKEIGKFDTGSWTVLNSMGDE